MAYQKGQNKPQGSGRKKGVPNKKKAIMDEAQKIEIEKVGDILARYISSPEFSEDLASLDAKDRLTIAERYMGYFFAKKHEQAVDLHTNSSILSERLAALSGRK
jgi:hypothetical protein